MTYMESMCSIKGERKHNCIALMVTEERNLFSVKKEISANLIQSPLP